MSNEVFYFLDIVERQYDEYYFNETKLTFRKYRTVKYHILCPNFLKKSQQAKAYVKELRKKLSYDSSQDSSYDITTKVHRVLRCRRKRIFDNEFYFNDFDVYIKNIYCNDKSINLTIKLSHP
jgi:hypothetical protein